ncbi:NAD(P)/FAD-dependent oxidoreductase [Sediminitomix flava]|nr:FAD-dependent oxidoreductase [Sediminitomix flava]
MLSYWENKHFTSYDFIIIGSGIVGLSTAASLAELHPNKSILVLEKGIFPTGASTKNAGFACFGSLTELLSDLDYMPLDMVMHLVDERWSGLQKLRCRLGDEAIEFIQDGGYELLSDEEIDALDAIDAVNKMLFPLFKKDVFHIKDELIEQFGFNSGMVQSVVYNPFEGQIDTGKMMRSLLNYVQQKNVTLLTGSEVLHFEDSGSDVRVEVKNTATNSPIAFSAQKLAICTNAFTPSLLPNLEVKAGRGQVLVTKPIENLKFKGVFHMDEGYYYFRNHGNRVIFGGGRNLDFQGESTTEFATTDQIIHTLQQKLKDVILPQQDFEIEHKWAGIMAFGKNKRPIHKKLSENVAIGVRLGGMGVAIGSSLGEKLAHQLSE